MNAETRYKKQSIHIGGSWLQADSAETFDVLDPATGKSIGTVPNAGRAETERAIAAADHAFQSYRLTSASERASLLRKLHDALMDNQGELADLLVSEQGKPRAEALGEIAISAAYVLWFAEEGRRVYGESIPSPWPDRRMMVIREPVGVVAAITPWNFPASMLARKIGPALAAGCTVVAKPASETPYSGLAWAALCEEVGFPPGVVNVVTGSAREIGDALCESPLVRKLTFTGSTRVGKMLLRKCADTVKKVSMELGGNAPFIVFDDADLEKAVEGATVAKFRNSGQTCVCANRFYVQAGIHDRFVEAFSAKARSLRVGAGLEDGIEQGPLINETAVAKIEELIGDAVSKGGELATGGRRHARGGLFFEPTVIHGAVAQMRLAREEIFGPVAPVFKFEDEDEVIAEANDTEFGLACYFYTSDLGRTYRMMESLRYGLVGVNEGLIATVEAPFGGLKESGLGKEGGRRGIEEYFDAKYVCLGGLGL